MPGFYFETPQDCLLLGDIVTGFRAVVPQFHKPGVDDHSAELGISVTRPDYFAVTTPCCSIGNKQISLAPLVPIRAPWLTNPYLADDLTRINVPGSAENFVPPNDRGRLTPEALQALVEKGSVYGLVECFVYDPHDLLRVYDVKGKGATTKNGHWLLEFGSSFRVNCDLVTRNAAPAGVKLLELSVAKREELRRKLVNYFGRTPEEDRLVLEGAATT